MITASEEQEEGPILAGGLLIVAALSCYAVASRLTRDAIDRRWWFACCGALMVLAVVRVLDIDDQFARSIARRSYRDGWYEQRRLVQGPIVALILAFTIIGMVKLWRHTDVRKAETTAVMATV